MGAGASPKMRSNREGSSTPAARNTLWVEGRAGRRARRAVTATGARRNSGGRGTGNGIGSGTDRATCSGRGREAATGVERAGVDPGDSFGDLCEKPLGASDYLRLAHDYHTLFIDRVPMMDYGDRNAAKRFIALIDTLYDNAVKLMASAAAEPHALYQASEGFEAMEFARTASRLFEMGSETYLALPHGRSDSTAGGASTGLVET